MNAERRFPIPSEWTSEEDLAIAASVRRWADEQIVARRPALREDPASLGPAAWPVLGRELGLLAVAWPEDLGGLGRNTPDLAFCLALAAEQLGRADVGLALDFAVHQALCAAVLVAPARPPDLSAMAPLLGPAAEARAVALIGPQLANRTGPQQHLFEGRALQARARATRDGWRLDAEGARPDNAGLQAGSLAVLAHLEGRGRSPGLLLVPADAEGVHRSEPRRRTGLWSSPAADLRLKGVTLAEPALLLEGPEEIHALESWLSLLTACACQGALLAVDEIIADWGESRVIKGRGQIFRDNPLAASIMGELAGQIACGRSLTYQLAYLLAHPEHYGPPGRPPLRAAAQNIGPRVCRSASTAIGRAMELMGSAGYAREWELERYWRDVRTVACGFGAGPLIDSDLARFHYGARPWPLGQEG